MEFEAYFLDFQDFGKICYARNVTEPHSNYELVGYGENDGSCKLKSFSMADLERIDKNWRMLSVNEILGLIGHSNPVNIIFNGDNWKQLISLDSFNKLYPSKADEIKERFLGKVAIIDYSIK